MNRQQQISAAAAKFHRDHPEFYAHLEQRTLTFYEAGQGHLGIGCLFEVARYFTRLGDKDSREFKLNNNFRAWYSRKLMRDHPELIDFFETRVQKSASRPAYQREWTREEAIAGSSD